jgi:hypothetical protein
MLAAWLVFQLVGITAPLIAATGSALQEACTCPGGAHATTCPMHHGKETPKDSTNRCSMTNAYAPADLALLALAGGAGLLPRLVTSDSVDKALARVMLSFDILSSRSELPDSPPPRT